MKKYITILLLVFFLSGCVKIDENTDINKIANYIIKTNVDLYNRTSNGYKYYIPQGVKLVSDKEFNQKFICDNSKIYLYVDVVSYYYKTNTNYEQNCDNCYYYTHLNYKDNKGYIKINKEEHLYLVEIVYNYSKIETYATKDNLKKLISYSVTILNSIDYNDVIISNMINNNYFDSVEKEYSLTKPNDSNVNMLEILEEYNTYEENYEYKLPEDGSNLDNE